MMSKTRRMIALLSLVLLFSGASMLAAQDARSPAKGTVTFIELGSVNCVPCKAMQPIMEEVRRKYGARVSVVFHDVWTLSLIHI